MTIPPVPQRPHADASAPVAVFYSADYLAAGHDFDTTRKAGLIAEALRSEPDPGVSLQTPVPVDRAELRRIHDEDFVEAVLTGQPRHLAASAGLGWDEGFVRSLAASVGGCRGAARAAWRDGRAGSLSSGLHHAARRTGRGFCTFNGVALAATAFLDAGARRVLVLDLDAHCGGGTHDILGTDPRITHVDVATDTFDRYHPCSERWSLEVIDRADDYLPTVAAVLDSVADGAVDAVVYNAGMDPHQDCDVGGLDGIDDATLAAREELVFDWADERELPIAFVLAGGYTGPRLDADHLTRLHLVTVEAAARNEPIHGR